MFYIRLLKHRLEEYICKMKNSIFIHFQRIPTNQQNKHIVRPINVLKESKRSLYLLKDNCPPIN